MNKYLLLFTHLYIVCRRQWQEAVTVGVHVAGIRSYIVHTLDTIAEQ